MTCKIYLEKKLFFSINLNKVITNIVLYKFIIFGKNF